MNKTISLRNVTFGNQEPFVFIAGPCVIENAKVVLKTAETLKAITGRLKIPFVFKASYDKANRTSGESLRGIGMTEGLAILKEVKKSLKVPILSDVHCVSEMEKAAEVLDIIQIPAFLCRQTNLLYAAADTGKIVNVKKGQFLAH